MTALAKLVVMCFTHPWPQADLVEMLADWRATLREIAAAPNGLEVLAMAMRSIRLANDHVVPEVLQNLLERTIGPEGIQQGERALLLRMLRRRFGTEVNAETERRLATASAEQLEAWAERVLSAATLTELLAD